MSYLSQSKTLGELVLETSATHGDRPAVMAPKAGEYEHRNYHEWREDVFRTAQQLHSLKLSRGDRLVIMADSSYTWALVDWAGQTLGLVTVPIYPTLPPDQAQYIVQDCEARAAVVADDVQAEKIKDLPGIKVLSMSASKLVPVLSEQTSSLELAEWEASARAGKREDLATIIYTSGTTGSPKGVMLPHRCFLSLCESIDAALPVSKEDRWLSFLPLSHVFERFTGHVLPIALGAEIAYAQSITTLAKDMEKAQPTIMCVVPRFLESVRSRVFDNIQKAPPLRQKLFHAALSQGRKKARGESAPFAGLLDKLVGAKIRARTGGRIRLLVSGGAALAPQVTEFFQAFNLTVLQGYGLTESCAASNVNLPERNRPDTVGPPIPGVECKIAADGEILLRGPSIMDGYFNLPEETAEAIDGEGWLHTGDIGELSNGYLKITDRKKDILVLANGKNVAPQKIENALKQSDLIHEAVLFGDGNEYVYGVIVPHYEGFEALLKEKGESMPSDEELIQRPDVREAIKKEVSRINTTLADFERVKRHALIAARFSVETGELTPSLKVKRRVIQDRFAPVIESLRRN